MAKKSKTPAARGPQQWTLPAATQEEYRLREGAVREAALQLGTLEADYVTKKNTVLAELEKRVKARMDVVLAAAKEAGLDVEAEKWTLDVKTMTLSKG